MSTPSRPPKPPPDRTRPGFEHIPTYPLTDEELSLTYDFADRLREAQCLYVLGSIKHIQRAGEVCDGLLQEPSLPAGLCLKVLVLLMSIEQDTDTIDKLLQRAKDLYNLVSLFDPIGNQ